MLKFDWLWGPLIGATAGCAIYFARRRQEKLDLGLSIDSPPRFVSAYDLAIYSFSGMQSLVPPDTWLTLPTTTIAALWYTGLIRSEQLPGVAADLLARGLDGENLRRLAGEQSQRTSIADLADLPDRAFHELGVEAPLSAEAAQVIVLRHLAHEVIADRLDPEKMASLVAYAYDWDSLTPAWEIINASYALEDRAHSPHDSQNTNAEIVAACESFLSRTVA